jgi:hypothetical protein
MMSTSAILTRHCQFCHEPGLTIDASNPGVGFATCGACGRRQPFYRGMMGVRCSFGPEGMHCEPYWKEEAG